MKKKTLGYILGGICFLPVFITLIIIMEQNRWIGLLLLLVTQVLWLVSITLCTSDLEVDNRILKNMLREEYKKNIDK